MTNKKGEQDWRIANKIRHQDLNMPLDSKGGFSEPIKEFLPNSNALQKDQAIALIKSRIMDEYRKHPQLDWADIAARKLYEQWNEYFKSEVSKEVIAKLNECFLPQNIECDGATCTGCWKDVVREVIKMIESTSNKK